MEFLQLHLCCAGRHSPQPIPAGQRLHIPGHPGCRHKHGPFRAASVPPANPGCFRATGYRRGTERPHGTGCFRSAGPAAAAAACAVPAAPPVLLPWYRQLPWPRAARLAVLFPAVPGHAAPGRRAFPAARVLRAAPAMALIPARSAPAAPEPPEPPEPLTNPPPPILGLREGGMGMRAAHISAWERTKSGGFSRVFIWKRKQER